MGSREPVRSTSSFEESGSCRHACAAAVSRPLQAFTNDRRVGMRFPGAAKMRCRPRARRVDSQFSWPQHNASGRPVMNSDRPLTVPLRENRAFL